MAVLAALCLLAGSLQVELPVDRFTLRWQHSIEKIDWEEDYRVAGDWLYLSSARVRGSGAGMEPPPGSFYQQGVWHYRPAPDMRWTRRLLLTRSEFARDYDLCMGGVCQQLSHWIPLSTGTTTAAPCPSR
ncbi:hypothetical protein MIZ03_0120 [Rhodoferax lithotrophicus]|uniref:DUF1850 domain-containing protein n=1 Tax=Rhodoferax lithotrophicus TaxID=2798804 RepID=A0ABM7MGE2_9BURK|nr:DUF1850 domain-containing protein [Rhodoferax sp. MIZ03]BCO25260.1 hypothetical protein MIZ03_0120 [Rhodoferax sp. MIZ03]